MIVVQDIVGPVKDGFVANAKVVSLEMHVILAV